MNRKEPKKPLGLGLIFTFSLLTLYFSLMGCAQNPNYVKGQALVRQGQWEEAVASLKEAVRSEPQNTKYQRELAAAQKALANHYYSLGQKALNSSPRDLPRILLAKSYFQKTLQNNPQYEGAKENLSQSILLEETLQKERDEVYERVKKAQGRHDWNTARQELQKILLIDSSYVPAREALRFTEKMLEVEVLLKEAKEAREKGDKNKRWEEAPKLLEEAQRLYPQSSDVKDALYKLKMQRVAEWVAQGDKFFTAKQYPEAINFYRRALALVPDHQKAVEGLDFAVGAQAEKHYLRAKNYQQKGLGGNAAAELQICQAWVLHFRDSEELGSQIWVRIKKNLPPKKGKRPSEGGVSEILERPYILRAKEWEEKGDKEKAVEEYCRAMAEDSRLNLWSKIFELKGFDPEKVKQLLTSDSF